LKVSALVTAIPIAGFIVLAPAFFRLWVPTVAGEELTLLSILTMGSMVASFGLMPLTFIFTITNKLKIASMSVFLSGILNLLIVLVLLRTTSLGLIAIAGVSSVLEALRFLVFVPLYAAHCLNIKPKVLYPSILKSLVYITLLIVSYFMISSVFAVASWLSLGFVALSLSVFGLFVGYVFMLDAQERARLRTMIPFKFGR
jgi:hypothetical protein